MLFMVIGDALAMEPRETAIRSAVHNDAQFIHAKLRHALF
jgi:hypothetical protein